MSTEREFTLEDECQYCGVEWKPLLRFQLTKDMATRHLPDTEELPTCEICYNTHTGNVLSDGVAGGTALYQTLAEIGNLLLDEIRAKA